MAKKKRKSIPAARSPLEQVARDSLTGESKRQQAYRLVRFAEKDFEGGISLNGMRMERLACVKALEGLARKHPKRKSIFLEHYHLMAASQYHSDLLAAQGQSSTTFRERIDVNADRDGGLHRRLDISRRILHAAEKLEPEELTVLHRIIRDRPDNTMAEIWPNRTERNTARELIKSGLHELAVFYGLIKG